MQMKIESKQLLNIKLRHESFILQIDSPDEVLVPSDWPIFLMNNINLKASEKEGIALDLGSGSGVLSVALFKMGLKKIDACDINPIAVETTEANFMLNEFKGNSRFVKSNMFENIKGKYNLIVTNPPTFPDNPYLRKNQNLDYAFFSGPDGREFLDIVIKEAKSFLFENGRIVLLHPSYLNSKLTMERLKKFGLQPNVLATMTFNLDEYSNFLQVNGYNAEIMKMSIIKNSELLGVEFKQSKSDSYSEFSLDLIEGIKI